MHGEAKSRLGNGDGSDGAQRSYSINEYPWLDISLLYRDGTPDKYVYAQLSYYIFHELFVLLPFFCKYESHL